MTKSNTQRQQEFKQARLKEGLVRREYWATPAQHAKIVKLLKK